MNFLKKFFCWIFGFPVYVAESNYPYFDMHNHHPLELLDWFTTYRYTVEEEHKTSSRVGGFKHFLVSYKGQKLWVMNVDTNHGERCTKEQVSYALMCNFGSTKC